MATAPRLVLTVLDGTTGLLDAGRRSAEPLVWLLGLVAVLAILSAVLDWCAVHFICKPLAMLVAIMFVVARAYSARATARFDIYLLAALGACVFMLSDALIAINRFVQPLPLVSLWVLASYYTAQILIVHYARPVVPVVPAAPATLA